MIPYAGLLRVAPPSAITQGLCLHYGYSVVKLHERLASLTIVPKQPTKTVSEIQVFCAYEKNANTAYFDNLSLVKEVAEVMKYDEDGNLVSVQSTGRREETSSYDNGNLTQVVTGGSGTFD